jgi:hypothetical protein
VLWSARRRDWAQARVIVPTIAVDAAAGRHARAAPRPLPRPLRAGLVEIYSVLRPLLAGLVVMQLAVAGRDLHSGARLPRGLRAALAGHALAQIVFGAGVLLWTGRSDASLSSSSKTSTLDLRARSSYSATPNTTDDPPAATPAHPAATKIPAHGDLL